MNAGWADISLTKVRNIWGFFFSSRSLKTIEKYTNWSNLVCLSLYIFWAQSHLCLLLEVNLFQKYLFLPQLTHNMTKDCPLTYHFSTWKFQAQNMGRTWVEHIVCISCSECQNKNKKQFVCATCSPHVLRLEFSCSELVIQWKICCHIVG